MLVYDTAPELLDELPMNDWDFGVVTDLVDLDGKTVIDAGAGEADSLSRGGETLPCRQLCHRGDPA